MWEAAETTRASDAQAVAFGEIVGGLHLHQPRNRTVELEAAIAGLVEMLRLGIGGGDRVKVHSPVGAVELTATISDQPRRGVVVIDHGWGSRVFDPRGGSAPPGTS